MTGNNSLRDQARAVFLAALVVLSVFGGTVAFAGTAAAADGTVSLDESDYASGDTITITATDSGANTKTDTAESVTVTLTSDLSGESESVTLTETGKDTDSFTGTITVKQASSATADDGTLQAQSGDTIQVTYTDSGSTDHTDTAGFDSKAPNLSPKSPADGDTVTSTTTQVNLDLTDADSSVDESTIHVVMTAQGEANPFIDEVGTDSGGITLSDGVLTIDPSDSNLQTLPEGTINVKVTAKDTLGNKATSEYSFTVNTATPGYALASPTDGARTNNQQQVIEINVKDGDAKYQIDKSTVSVTLKDSGSPITNFDGITTSSSLVTYVENSDSPDVVKVQPTDSKTLPAGSTITVEISADDSNSDTYSNADLGSFTVDTTKPEVSGITFDGDDTKILDSETGKKLDVTVNFDSDMNTNQAPTVQVEGLASSPIDVTGTFTDSRTWVGTVIVPDDDEEVNPATLKVTGGQDLAGNGLDTQADSNTLDLNVDTKEPTVTPGFTADVGDTPVIKGTINFADKFTVNNADGKSVMYEMKGEADGASYSAISNPTHHDTTGDADGTYTVRATVSDDSGNQVSAEKTLVIDNVDPSISVKAGYQPSGGTPARAAGIISLSDVFSVSHADGNTPTLAYATYDESTGQFNDFQSASDNTIDTTLLSDGKVKLKATVTEDGNADTATQTVIVNVDNEGDTEGVYATDPNNDGTVDIAVKSTRDLASLEVTVTDSHHFTGWSKTITNFESEQDGALTRYYTTVDAPRDGEFDVEVTSAKLSDDSDASVKSSATTVTVDTSAPSITDADVVTAGLVSADKPVTLVRVEFSEPVSGVTESDFTFTGDASVIGIAEDKQAQGYVVVILDKEAQTAGDEALEIAADSYTEAYGNSDSNDADSEDVSSIELTLHSGVNVVSVPAETGTTKSLDSMNLGQKGVEQVLAYRDGGWASYTPSALSIDDFDKLTGGEGYVIRVADGSGPVDLDFDVENVPADGAKMSYEKVDEGWNLVGAYQEGTQSVGKALTWLDTGGATYSVQQGYTNSQADSLEGGEGYWLFTNKAGYHAPVDYLGANSEQPTVYTKSGEDLVTSGAIQNGGTLDVQAIVDDERVSTVLVDAPALGINQKTLTYDAAAGGSTAGDYYTESDISVDYDAGYDGGKTTVTVTAIDTEGNVGTYTETVDPADRSGSVTITESDLSDGQISVDTSYNGGVENAELVVTNERTSKDVATVSSPNSDGSNTFSVEMNKVDKGDTLVAKLVDVSEDGTYVVPSSDDMTTGATDSEQVSGLQDLAYTLDGNHLDQAWSGADAIQSAISSDAAGPVYVESGHYNAFTLEEDLTVQNAEGATPVVDQQAGSQSAMVFVQNDADGATIKGLTISAKSQSGTTLGIKVRGGTHSVTGPNTVTLESNVIKQTQTAIQVSGSAPVDVSGNTIHHVAAGVSVQTDDVTISNGNTITVASNGEGVGVGGNAEISGNTITVTSDYSISDLNGDYVTSWQSDHPGRAITLYSMGELDSPDDVGSNTYNMETGTKAIVDANPPEATSISSTSFDTTTDTITVTFSEPVTSVSTDDFTVNIDTDANRAGYETTDASLDSKDINGNEVTLTLANDFDNSAVNEVQVQESGTSDLQDDAGNKWAGTSTGSVTKSLTA